MNLVTIILFVISLCLLVMVHEIGHFTMAKVFKVYCHEFAIGFGPRIYSKKIGETKYSIRAIPLGGYVLMQGEELEDEKDVPEEERLKIPHERSIEGVAKWKRAIIMSAGIILNFVLAFVLFFCNNMFFTQKAYSNQVAISSENSTAYIEGLRTGDAINRITLTSCSLNEASVEKCVTVHDIKNITTINDLSRGLTFPANPKKNTDTMKLTLYYTHLDSSITQSSDFVLKAITEDEGKTFKWEKIGIEYYYVEFRYDFAGAIKASGEDWVESSTEISRILGGLFVGENWDAIGGPVSILAQSSQVLDMGFGKYLQMWGLISVNLAIFNLLPFPGLDGWHLLVITVEGVTRKKIPQKVKVIVSFVGMALLFGLMIFVFGRDIINLF